MKTYQWLSDPRGGHNTHAMWSMVEWTTDRLGQWFVTVGDKPWQVSYYAIIDDFGTLQPVKKVCLS